MSARNDKIDKVNTKINGVLDEKDPAIRACRAVAAAVRAAGGSIADMSAATKATMEEYRFGGKS